eukprot:s1379_g23.t1
MNGIVIVSSEFCVLQELKKQDVEMHLSKHPVARSRWRDLLKVRNIWKQDGSNDRQIDMLQESPFFNDEMPVGFAKAVHQSMEVRLFFPEEVVQDKDDPTDVLYLVCEGQMERMSNGKKSTLDVGGIWGEAGLLSDKDGPPETLVAKSVCGVMALHRRNMIDVFDSFPEAKAKIEAISRRSREGIFEAGGQSWNIYRMSCFKDCSSRFLYLLDLHLERHIYFSDETVVVENTEGEDMYILYSGAMEVKVKGITVGKLEGGMFFGEMAVLGLVKKRSATIIAKTLCDVRLLSRRSLEEALSEFPEEISRFEELAATRNRLSLEHRNGGRVRHLCSFFQDCNPKFATAIADDMQDKLFLSGQVLCREGLPQDSLFLIHQGTANVTVQQQRVSELKSGDICGELVALGLSPVTTATITAMDTCFVQELRSNVLMTVLDKFPEERQKLRQLAALRMEWRYALHDLQNFDWIRGTPAAFPTLLEQMITRWIFFRGDEMMVQGSPGDSLMMISSGSVEIVHDEQVIRELGGGDVLGELGALGIARLRTATVRCKDICDVYVLAKAALTRALSLHPEQMDPLRKLATARMRSDVERASEKHVLLNCPLFQQSSRKFLDRISEHLEDRLFMEGEDLCIEGEKGDTMFVLIQGTLNVFVKIDGKNKKVNELHKGSVIGEIAVLGLANHRTATLTAKTVCLVQILHRPILMKYLNEFPREIATFQEVGASRLTKSGISKNTLFPQQVLFRYCGSAFVEEVCKTLQRKICFPGQIIVEEGAESQEMYAIAQGHASVEKGGTLLGELQQGSAFGEKAVLGMMSIQLVSIKAESMCDLQYLNCHDLETMLANFTEEKKHLLQAVAGMMREEIAEITDHEILQEVPLLAVLGDDFTQHLLASLQVGAARRDEPVKSKSEELFVVILQGRASVQLDGSILRELSEGESFGEAACLGLAVPPKGDLAVELFVVGQSCLYLYATKDAVQRALQQEGAHMRDKLRGSVTMAPGFGRVVLESSPLSFLQMTQDQLTQLYDRCEEGFCLETQDLLSARHRQKTLLFLLAGKASCQVGDEELVLEPGSSLVQTSKDGPGRGPVTAIVHCKYLLLNKRVLLSVLKAQPEEDQALQCGRSAAFRDPFRRVCLRMPAAYGETRHASRSASCEEAAEQGRGGGGREGREGRDGRGGEQGKLFIGQLSFEAEEGDIQEKFGRYGQISSVQIIKDNATGKSKGYGFIKFADPADAEKVLRTMDGADICGRRCKLDRAGGGKSHGGGQNMSRYERDDRRGGRGRDGGKAAEPEKLFIGKLSLDATEEDVQDAFRRLCDVKVQIIKDRDTGEARGFGFITFPDSSKAEEALRSLQGAEVAGQPCRLERPGQKRGTRDGSPSRSQGRRDHARARSRSRGRGQGRDDWDARGDDRRHGHGRRRERDAWDARGPRDRERRERGERERGGDRERDRPERGERGERGDRGRRERDRPQRGESQDSRAADREQRRGERQRSRTPDGLPRKSEAINAARVAYEETSRRLQMAQTEADSAEAAYKKMQKAADHAVDRKVAEESSHIKRDLETKLGAMKAGSKNALALALDDAELQLRQELADKISQMKKEYQKKVEDEHVRIRRQHAEEAEDAEAKVQEEAEDRIKELRRKAEEEENPWEWREARDKAVEALQKEEEKLDSAKRRLETLTGGPVKDRRSRSLLPRDREKRKRVPPPPPQARVRD